MIKLKFHRTTTCWITVILYTFYSHLTMYHTFWIYFLSVILWAISCQKTFILPQVCFTFSPSSARLLGRLALLFVRSSRIRSMRKSSCTVVKVWCCVKVVGGVWASATLTDTKTKKDKISEQLHDSLTNHSYAQLTYTTSPKLYFTLQNQYPCYVVLN